MDKNCLTEQFQHLHLLIWSRIGRSFSKYHFILFMVFLSRLSIEKVLKFDVRWFVIIRFAFLQCHDKVENLLTSVLQELN